MKPIKEVPRQVDAEQETAAADDHLIRQSHEDSTRDSRMEVDGDDAEDMAEPVTQPTKKRKRKEREEESKVDELESRYMDKVYIKISKTQKPEITAAETSTSTALTLPQTNEDEEIDPELLQHETLTPNSDAAEKTIFLSNVPVKVLTSKPLLKSLKKLFSTYGDIVSIRFRSIAFSEGGPRKLAFVTKKLHSERDSLNAYIVYQRAESVDDAVQALNGLLWEGKHLRVDSVSHPTVTPQQFFHLCECYRC